MGIPPIFSFSGNMMQHLQKTWASPRIAVDEHSATNSQNSEQPPGFLLPDCREFPVGSNLFALVCIKGGRKASLRACRRDISLPRILNSMNCTSNGCSKSFVHLKTLVACWCYHLRGCIITPSGDITTTLWRNLGTPGQIGFTQLSLLLVWGMSPISRDATFLLISSNSRITVDATFLLKTWKSVHRFYVTRMPVVLRRWDLSLWIHCRDPSPLKCWISITL